MERKRVVAQFEKLDCFVALLSLSVSGLARYGYRALLLAMTERESRRRRRHCERSEAIQ
jgi:hypothetical protein